MKSTASKVAVALTAALCISGANAKVLHQATTLNAGYWFELSQDSEDSGKANQSIISAQHRLIADWGSLFVKGQIENFGNLDDGVNGADGTVTYKTFVSAYYNLGDSGAQLWYDEFSVGNTAISENHHYFGAAYGHKFGKLNTKVGVAYDYVFGHSPVTGFDGFGAYAARLDVTYPLLDKLMLIGMFDYRWDIDDGIATAFDWGNNGYHAVVGANYRINSHFSTALVYHKFDSWGAYNNGGDSLLLNIGYQF